jgi:hypothetical protein
MSAGRLEGSGLSARAGICALSAPRPAPMFAQFGNEVTSEGTSTADYGSTVRAGFLNIVS